MPATVTVIKCFCSFETILVPTEIIYQEEKFNFHSLPTEQLLQQQDG